MKVFNIFNNLISASKYKLNDLKRKQEAIKALELIRKLFIDYFEDRKEYFKAQLNVVIQLYPSKIKSERRDLYFILLKQHECLDLENRFKEIKFHWNIFNDEKIFAYMISMSKAVVEVYARNKLFHSLLDNNNSDLYFLIKNSKRLIRYYMEYAFPSNNKKEEVEKYTIEEFLNELKERDGVFWAHY